jgi:uncharacterized membrane protein YebE (DUF533 family)
MFDPKSLLDALVRGNAQQNPGASSGGGLEDLLRNFLPDAGAGASRSGSPQSANPGPEQGSSGNPLGDLLSKLQQGGQGGGGLGDILGKLQQQAGQGGGGIADILGQVFGQATSGVREGAGRIDQATGASDRARDVMGQLTGRSPDELMTQLKELLANNQMGAGAALGGLGALILGTGAGRSLAGSAIKLGGLALIGGLAYKALQNYQQGVPPLTGGKAAAPAQALLAAPRGSGFEAEAATGEHATILIRAMIAAAAADGRIDAAEQKKILGGFGKSDLDPATRQFLARELQKPATPEELASACSSPEEAAKIYTAARISVDVDSDEEHEFLEALAQALGIDEDLAAHIDAAARTAA